MKRTLSFLLTLALALSLAACGGNAASSGGASESAPRVDAAEPAPEQPSAAVPADTASNDLSSVAPEEILIAYFGVVEERNGADTVANASRVGTDGGVVGNCQFIAQAIQEAVGGDLFAIETVQDYPLSHEALLEFAYNELRKDARPELSGEIGNLEDYRVIFLGYPNWNADLPMPLYTFLETYDFSGKTIIPFVTHGGSGFSRTISTIAGLQPGAEVLTGGLSISRGEVRNAAQEAMDWASGIFN